MSLAAMRRPGRKPGHPIEGTPPRRRGLGLLLVVVAIGLVLAARTWVFTPYQVASDSMAPTLQVGRTVYVEHLSTLWDGIDRQDLVTFIGPEEELMLKRVVAVAGDRVEIYDAVLNVNGVPVEEPYVDPATLDGIFFGPVTVPDGSVFVMGDNRFDSIDSRNFGPVAESDIVGRIVRP